ncbi:MULTISPECIES: fumarylacetoacetate hydrolase family protein [unclassified Beijerinckia]|uniref:fumarylacetoacetate hydrolase family protein n=1 Tax=unclassified Beijerinckia TaxID=2638183 RepID=UPI00089555BE|nr:MULTISPECIES: fumarylacetoacetate hydrolase family protein [unclassified Beijerinckia]MDH7797064.1 2-keto-4-pentenoate hydratase/2-oxohepta-3-ene-1,7-dioic acid hydratase in catechol pathway [Beijerinckia sp. GAS462]SEC70811.1 2-keto-4-pentenoate hydratase/2-oxohepta-3-ene-1,7-dioic acid hydratase (catechol pathway) [Beijerinckia sp. 28-YEA-48]
MKVVCFEHNRARKIGVIDEDHVVDIASVDNRVSHDVGALLVAVEGELSRLKAVVAKAKSSDRMPLSSIKYALPISSSSRIICLGLNYLEHLKEGRLRDTSPQHPSIFMRIPSSFVAQGEDLVRHKASEQFDYEGELVAYVGKPAKYMTMENALSCISGYSCGNEGTVRDFQRHTTQWGMGKNFDRSGSIGPWIVDAKELPPGGKGLRLETRRNGTVMQSDSTSSMMFPLAETIVYLTKGIQLLPGDIIFTGTPSGVGAARKPEPVWLKSGDRLEIEIEGVGLLQNRVVDVK